KDPPLGMTNGYILDTDGRYDARWMGIMGCVPYKIDIDQIEDLLVDEGIMNALNEVNGGIYIPIGKVDFAVNREELQYTNDSDYEDDEGVTHTRQGTKTVLVQHFKALLNEYFETLMATVEDESIDGWERRSQALFLHRRLQFPLPARFDEYTKASVNLWSKNKSKKPLSFTMRDNNNDNVQSIPINISTQLLIKDDEDTRATAGWNRDYYDVIIVPVPGFSRETVREELTKVILAADCHGVTVNNLEDNHWWQAPSKRGGSWFQAPNAKHRESTFVLTGTDTHMAALSNNWEIVKPPTEEHVYFIINAFRVNGKDNFYRTINKDRALALQYEMNFPEDLYGYKNTSKNPIRHEDIQNGTHYYTWRKNFFSSLMTDKRKGQLRNLAWSKVFDNIGFYYERFTYDRKTDARIPDERNFEGYLPGLIARLAEKLGAKHPITRLFTKPVECREA
ncbi:unnamed protein product, partial [marine sediment metagenome]